MSDVGKLINRLRGTLGIEEVALFDGLFDVPSDVFDKAADDGAAATTTADTKIWSNPYPFPVQIVGITYSATGGGIAANDTNYAQIQAKADDGLGGATAIGAVIQTTLTNIGGFQASGNISANVGVTGPGIVSGTVGLPGSIVPVGGNLFVAITKVGAGVVVRAGKLCVRLRKI